jgi:Acetyltransferase (GNAT) domain
MSAPMHMIATPSCFRVHPAEIHWLPDMPVYASKEFLESEGDSFGWIAGSNAGGRLLCVLPYTIIRKAGLQMVRFKTQTIPVQAELSLEEEKVFLASVVGYFRSAGIDIIIPSGNTAIFRTFPDGAAAAPYGTFIKDLTKSEPVLLSEIRKTFRQNIRKAVAAGVQIKSGFEYLDVAYELVAATLKRSGSKFKTYADFKQRVMALGTQVKLFVAEHDGVVQGCMVAPFSLHTAYNCYAGSLPQPVLGSMHLLHWEAIRQFRGMGVMRFDFQGVRIRPDKGSKQEGIFHYKQGFGGDMFQGYLWKYPLRPLKSAVYSLGVRLLMGGDIVDQEHGKLSCLASECGEVAVG